MSADRPIPDIAAEAHSLLANVLNPTVPDVLPLVKAYYAKPGNSAGGSLCVALDDGKVADYFVSYCLEKAEERGDRDGAAIAKVLLKMSQVQRLKLARMK